MAFRTGLPETRLSNPVTYTGAQCNERARTVVVRVLERIDRELDRPDPNAELLAACATVLEACANDYDVDAS